MSVSHMIQRSPQPLADADADAPKAASTKPRLLIVDDISDNRTVLSRRFQRRGFEIIEAESGFRALDLIAEQQFDAVLLDVMMPGMDGFQVLERIRADYSPASLPVVMVTAKSQSSDIVNALQRGANDYVTKPVDFDVALARINTQIERKRAEDAVVQSNEALRQVNEDLESRVHERTARLVEANQQLRSEIAQRQKSEERTQYLAHHDALTGLANRLLFRQKLQQALDESGATGRDLAVMFIDLDGFKSVNDTLGHSVGDTLLKIIAGRLRDCLDVSDCIARLGGDEFAILQMSTGQPKSAITLAAQMIEVTGESVVIDGHELTVGASIGIATSHNGEGDPETLLKCADLAMYRAKAAGRGTYRVFNPEMDERAQARRRLEIDLRNALAHGQFQLFYQPIVTLDGRKVSGFEALLRWNHPTRGMISPIEFVPVAEEVGLIVPLGEWVLRQACVEALSWPADTKVAVNLSSVQFLKGNLVASVVNALASSGLAPARLELEITESVLLEKTERNLETLNQLRGLGVRISMDDFGTGYSSLSYLRSFRFDKIKIDQSFIRDLSSDEESRAIVRAIAALGVSFGIDTTAEGVETAEQLRCLNLEGCTEVQGKYFSMPVPANSVGGLLRELGQI